MKQLTLDQAKLRYGEINFATKQWPDEQKWMLTLELPFQFQIPTWINSASQRPVSHVYINRDMVDPLLNALNNIHQRQLTSELKTFDGLFMIRFVRGMANSPSTHAYGCAIDINAHTNPLGGPAILSPAFVACWKDAGFSWGGEFGRVDGMHFSYAWE